MRKKTEGPKDFSSAEATGTVDDSAARTVVSDGELASTAPEADSKLQRGVTYIPVERLTAIEGSPIKKTFTLGKRFAACANGKVYAVEKHMTPYHPVVRKELSVLRSVDGLPICTGLTVILGPAGTGKTPLLNYLTGSVDGHVIHHGEPFPGFSTEDCELALRVLASDSPVIAIDSVKNLIGRLGGAASARGISRELFPMLSDLASEFASAGRALILTINISSDNDLVFNEISEAIKSNATMAIFAGTDSRCAWFARTGVGLKRRSGVFNIKWAGNGQISKLEVTDDDDTASSESSAGGHVMKTIALVLGGDPAKNAVSKFIEPSSFL